jgi:hypothetical protein
MPAKDSTTLESMRRNVLLEICGFATSPDRTKSWKLLWAISLEKFGGTDTACTCIDLFPRSISSINASQKTSCFV